VLVVLLLTYLELINPNAIVIAVALLLSHVLTILLVIVLLGTFILGRVEFIVLILNHHFTEFCFGLLVRHLLGLGLDDVQRGLVLLGARRD
jgi:hypothetical protein